MDIKEVLFSLSKSVCIGNVHEASNLACRYLSEYMPVEHLGDNTVVGTLKGESDYTLLLDAHIDEIGFVVTNVSDGGFLTVAACGGIDLRTLKAKCVNIHSNKGVIKGVFCSTPPHLKADEENFSDISEFKIDTLLGKKAKDIISVGDFVTFDAEPVSLLDNKVCGKSFDNRASVAVLIELAKRLKGKKLPVTLKFLFSDMEELGTRGAVLATYNIEPNEAIVLDVSFGDAPDVSEDECGKLSNGAMIGISPTLSKEMSDKFIEISKEKSISYQLETMSGRTGTNADVISLSKSGVKTGLISIPLRNMHTSCEVVDLADLNSVCDILENYILGVKL